MRILVFYTFSLSVTRFSNVVSISFSAQFHLTGTIPESLPGHYQIQKLPSYSPLLCLLSKKQIDRSKLPPPTPNNETPQKSKQNPRQNIRGIMDTHIQTREGHQQSKSKHGITNCFSLFWPKENPGHRKWRDCMDRWEGIGLGWLNQRHQFCYGQERAGTHYQIFDDFGNTNAKQEWKSRHHTELTGFRINNSNFAHPKQASYQA